MCCRKDTSSALSWSRIWITSTRHGSDRGIESTCFVSQLELCKASRLEQLLTDSDSIARYLFPSTSSEAVRPFRCTVGTDCRSGGRNSNHSILSNMNHTHRFRKRLYATNEDLEYSAAHLRVDSRGIPGVVPHACTSVPNILLHGYRSTKAPASTLSHTILISAITDEQVDTY